jgi:hypothetical protein
MSEYKQRTTSLKTGTKDAPVSKQREGRDVTATKQKNVGTKGDGALKGGGYYGCATSLKTGTKS